MDGIFGVGILEMVVIVLVLMIIGGPRNTVQWAREAGRIMRQLQEAWQNLTKDLANELDDETKELLSATRDLTKGARDVAGAANPKRLAGNVSKVAREFEDVVKDINTEMSKDLEIPTPKKKAEGEPKQEEPASNGERDKYADWLQKE